MVIIHSYFNFFSYICTKINNYSLLKLKLFYDETKNEDDDGSYVVLPHVQ